MESIRVCFCVAQLVDMMSKHDTFLRGEEAPVTGEFLEDLMSCFGNHLLFEVFHIFFHLLYVSLPPTDKGTSSPHQVLLVHRILSRREILEKMENFSPDLVNGLFHPLYKQVGYVP